MHRHSFTFSLSHSLTSRGVIALLTVIVVGSLILLIGLSAATIGQTDLVMSGHADRGRSTRLVATACVEEALYRLKFNSGYVGGTLAVGSDTCNVTVSGSGSTRTITASATAAGYTRSVTAGAVLKQNAAANARAWAVDTWTEGDPP